MRCTRILSPTLLALFAATTTAHAVERPHYDAAYDEAATNIGPRTLRAPGRLVSSSKLARTPTSAAPIPVSSRDVRRDVPTLAWAGRTHVAAPPNITDPRVVARFHLDKLASQYDLSSEAVASAVVKNVHDTGRGAIIVSLGQEVDGVEIFRQRMNLLLARNLDLVAVGGALHRAATVRTRAGASRWLVTPSDALAQAVGDLYQMPVASTNLVEKGKTPGGYVRFDLAPALPTQVAHYRFARPARIKPVFYPMPEALVPAYYVEVFAGKLNARATDTYAYVIAADDGRVLYRANLTAHVAYNYRVWAEATGNHRPLDGPIQDFTPHPTGKPDGTYPAFIPPVLVSMEGFNTSPSGTSDPWLPVDATETSGNNVDAYSDDQDPDGYSTFDLRALPTSSDTFDRIYDTSKDPLDSAEQTMAAVTQLFYVVNWMHDSWYDSGFDEAAGNAQVDNYGRGGMGNDPLLAEAQDGALLGYSDNANMSTPADGESPKMQMYIWSGSPSGSVDITESGAVYAPGFADFGPADFDITGDVVLAADATAPVNDICSAVINDIAGKIALIDRGNCTFESKVIAAQNAGALAVIIANHTAGAPAPNMPRGNLMSSVTIPVLSVTFEDGKAIKDALTATVTAKISRKTSVRPDGTIDNNIVAHEWGHYLHNRLVYCATNQCGGEGEGWGDFVALNLLVRPSDNLDGTFASSIYAPAAFDNAAYFGIRRYPYTVNMQKNPLTFKHITDGVDLPPNIPTQTLAASNSEVHNTGEVWASMLFEGYVQMLKESKAPNPRYTFVEAQRRMQDYVVAGMKLAPVNPTFTEQRDGILAAALAADEKDALLLAQGFAKRGAGSCAESPDRESEDNSGVVESFEVTPAIAILSIQLETPASKCDEDKILDAHETGTLTVEMANTGILALQKAEVSVESAFPGLRFLNGSTVSLENVAPLEKVTRTFDFVIGGPNEPTVVPFDVKIKSEETCNPEVSKTASFRVNYDNIVSASATDTFDSDIEVWTRRGTNAALVWSRASDETLNYVWHGNDLAGSTDTRIESLPVKVSDTEDLVITFKHRHSFEASPEMAGGPDVYWDGGVIEISGINGNAWQDIADLVDPGYGGTLYDQDVNTLANRKAFVGTNPSWPEMDTVTLPLGKALAGRQIQIRFRIGSDAFVGDYGWDIDDVSFSGIEGTPFPAPGPSRKLCNEAPVANAGPDVQVAYFTDVFLDASKSSDPDGDPLTFKWTQLTGPVLDVEDSTTQTPRFVAPAVATPQTFTFQLAVSDGIVTSMDTVDVVVGAAPYVAGGGACSMVTSGKTEQLPLAAGAFIGLVALVRRNRRAARHNRRS